MIHDLMLKYKERMSKTTMVDGGIRTVKREKHKQDILTPVVLASPARIWWETTMNCMHVPQQIRINEKYRVNRVK